MKNTLEISQMELIIPGIGRLIYILTARLSRKVRRQFLLNLWRAIEQTVPHATEAYLTHSDSKGSTHLTEMLRPVSQREGVRVETPAEKIGSQLRFNRLKCRMTQAELAKRTGMARSAISEIEHGKRNVRQSTLTRLQQEIRRAQFAHADAQAAAH